jgi:glutamate-1-semialdehyde aminotransferase
MMYPLGASPLFLEKGRGAYVWDVDGIIGSAR